MAKPLLDWVKRSLLATAASANLFVPNPVNVTAGVGLTLHRAVGAYNYCSMVVIDPTHALTVRHCGEETNVLFTPGYGRDEAKPANYPNYTITSITHHPTDDLEIITFTPAAPYWIPVSNSDIAPGTLVYLAAQGFPDATNSGSHIVRVGTSIVDQRYMWPRFTVGYTDPTTHPTLNEGAAVLHDSGSGMFTVDASGLHAELKGIMNSGGYGTTNTNHPYAHAEAINLFFYKDWIRDTINAQQPINLIADPTLTVNPANATLNIPVKPKNNTRPSISAVGVAIPASQ